MPIIHRQQLEPAGVIGWWEIEEDEAWFKAQMQLSAVEMQQLDQIKGRRRLEWLAVRQLVHLLSGRSERGALVKDHYGKPHLDASPWHISVSHSWNLAAAVAAPQPVGVDIQRIVRKIDRLQHKFLSETELETVSGPDRLEKLHVYWCAKEALYKAYGRRELDFCKHLHVAPMDLAGSSNHTQGWVAKNGFLQSFDLFYRRIPGDYILVYAMAHPIVQPITKTYLT